MKDNYKGYTVKELMTILDYDKETGIFKSMVSGKELVGYGVAEAAMPHRTFSYREPVSKKVINFQLARVAYMIGSGCCIEDKERITYKDGDVYNLKYDNLVLVSYNEMYKKPNSVKNEYLETDEEHIWVGSINRMFVVRRGSTQSVYRTYDKQEAVAVRDRWLASGKKLNEFDRFIPKWCRESLKQEENV